MLPIWLVCQRRTSSFMLKKFAFTFTCFGSWNILQCIDKHRQLKINFLTLTIVMMHIMINFLFWSMAINLTSFLVDNRNKIHYVKLYISNRLNWKWRPRWITETKLVNNMHSYTSLNLIKQNNQKNMLNHSQKNVPYFMSDSHCRTDHYIVFSISQHEW
jgi:hypothetical protein